MERWRQTLLLSSGFIVFLASIPFLLFAMLIGSRLLMIVVGPVNIWNTTWQMPPVKDVAGCYTVLDENRAPRMRPGQFNAARSGFRLYSDYRLEVTELPAFDGFGEPSNCTYSGKGKWSSDGDGGVRLILNIEDSIPAESGGRTHCAPAALGLFQLLGHSPPYRIWYYIGDPDEGTGMTYTRRDR